MKHIFITGAATGIGCCTAKRLSKNGYHVFAGIMPGQDTTELLHNSSNISIVEIDVTKDESVKTAAETVTQAVGVDGLYALHNNAGIANIASGPLAGISTEETKTILDINAIGMIRTIQAFLPLLHLQQNARIVNMSSSAARVPVPTAGTYMMSKMAVEAITRTLRIELAPWGIQVSCIEPGGVRTPMTAGAEENLKRNWEKQPQHVRDRYEKVLVASNIKLVKQLEDANDPEVIVDVIEKAVNAAKLKVRYVAGKDVKFLPMTQRLMSEEMFENILLGQFGLKRNSEVKQ